MSRRTLASILLIGTLAASGPLAALPIYVNIAPPAPRVEVQIAAPGPGYVWVGGYHRWHGGAYVWVPGRWARPPHAGVIWVPGVWKNTPHGWVWKNGHWH
ncbi:MAG TPA: YXWGXW repeat-containing protein [Thermoanaerobaculia bacterium]|jgi:hypothetical protein|nr:YXWGXW repeat-containing protein [Thermoanaerobaculia bacterium]